MIYQLLRFNAPASPGFMVIKEALQFASRTVQRKSLKRPSSVRTMSDHLDRTAQSFRQQGISEAEVVSIEQASETVRLLTLRVSDPVFTFKAGQWVDTFIPGEPVVGGFSMTTGLSELRETGLMGLGVKYSPHPPAHWVHKQCVVGSKVHIRAGGDKLVYDPQVSDPSWNVLLLAGGIGINPLVSMLHHLTHLHTVHGTNPEAYKPGRAALLFSAATKSKLIFKDVIDKMVTEESPITTAKYFVTKETTEDPQLSRRRIERGDVKEALDRLGEPRRCFICGPPPMIAAMETILRDEGVRDEDVYCEKWW